MCLVSLDVARKHWSRSNSAQKLAFLRGIPGLLGVRDNWLLSSAESLALLSFDSLPEVLRGQIQISCTEKGFTVAELVRYRAYLVHHKTL